MNRISIQRTIEPVCADCGGEIGNDKGPPDGWQLEDGRTVCHNCCVRDTKQLVQFSIDHNAMKVVDHED